MHENFEKHVDAIAGPPRQITHPVINKIAERLAGLTSKVEERLPLAKLNLQKPVRLDSVEQKRNFILAAANLFPEEVAAQTNLVTARPPDNVHRMQRSNPYWVGDFFSANMIVHALSNCGLESKHQRILDVGCSSGSLVRVLAAYEGSWEMHGCDPIASAISWAKEHVNSCSFHDMGNNPPLQFDSGIFDGATAISVWSHHRPDAAEDWAKEVARILKPGGWFAVTFSSVHHVRWLAKNKRMPVKNLSAMLRNMARTGNHFVPMNYDGEDNETTDNWGQSAYSRERFFDIFIDAFDVAGYFPGLNQGNQDLAVFVKRH